MSASVTPAEKPAAMRRTSDSFPSCGQQSNMLGDCVSHGMSAQIDAEPLLSEQQSTDSTAGTLNQALHLL